MLPSLRKAPILAIIFMFLVSGCADALQPLPTEIPTFTATSLPTNTPIPTNTELTPCDADQTIKNLKSKIAYNEFVVLYFKMQRLSTLEIWFVDPEIDPSAQENEITENTNLAIRHALLLSQELNAKDACTSRLFDEIYTVVVDKNYNGWFSGQILTVRLPPTVQTDEKQLDELAKFYKTTYLREKVVVQLDSAPSNSCTWLNAKQNIQNHFSPERENVDFYLVIDESGTQVWTQWDSEPEFLQSDLPTSLLTVATEINCLFPQPWIIFFQVVDKTGQPLIVGSWYWADARNQDLSKVNIDYLYGK